MMKTKETCASRIREALRLRDMTQAELCKITEIPKSAMSQYCNGGLLPRQNRIYLIAKALNVSEAWLMGFDVPMDRYAFVDRDDAEFLRSLEGHLKPLSELSPELEALNILLHPLGEVIIKVEDKYLIAECSPLTEDEMNELLNSVVLYIKTQIDLLKAKSHKEMLDFFAKKNNR